WTGTHGGLNNTFNTISNAMVTTTTGLAGSSLLVETFGEVAEKAGKKVAILDWPGTLPGTKVKGPVVDYRNFYSSRGVVGTYESPGASAGFIRDFGLVYTSGLQLADATGWTGAPTSYSPAKETSFSYAT